MGREEWTRPLNQLNGTPAAEQYIGASRDDIPPWNRWQHLDQTDTQHLHTQHRLWNGLGVNDRFRLMLVDSEHRLVGLLDVLVTPGHDVDNMGQWLRKTSENLCHELHRARAVERSLEPSQTLGTVWIRQNERAQPCRAARTVWSHPQVQRCVRHAIATGTSEHIDFVGPQCIQTSRLSQSQLVWFVPSDDINAPLFGKLRPTLRRVAGALSVGATASAIAIDLNRSHETVRSHIRSIYKELGVDSRVNVARLASQVYWS